MNFVIYGHTISTQVMYNILLPINRYSGRITTAKIMNNSGISHGYFIRSLGHCISPQLLHQIFQIFLILMNMLTYVTKYRNTWLNLVYYHFLQKLYKQRSCSQLVSQEEDSTRRRTTSDQTSQKQGGTIRKLYR